jgi:peptide-methionine (S)-S-oxide reductase
MRTIAIALACAGIIGIVVAMQAAPKAARDKGAASSKKNMVGTRPGDIGKAEDIDAAAHARGHELATFAAGCFWGVEERFRQIPGVLATAVGYTGGQKQSPTYKDVCDGNTGHAEGVLIEFDPKRVSYSALVDVFYKNHNPTTRNRQGPDVGSQYRSAIFYRSADQERAAREATAALQPRFGSKIVTEIAPSSRFWMAEDYHQQYCAKNGIEACPIR